VLALIYERSHPRQSNLPATKPPRLLSADGREILSSVVASQIDIHRKYGGVVPELASREHLRQIVSRCARSTSQAGLSFSDLDAVASRRVPVSLASLLVGITYAKTLAQSLGKPLVPVNPSRRSCTRRFSGSHKSDLVPELPAVCLIVSGGHTVLYEAPAEQGTRAEATAQLRYRKLGQTRDDAAGEAYDKVSKLSDLAIRVAQSFDRLAAAAGSAPPPVKFSPIKMKGIRSTLVSAA